MGLGCCSAWPPGLQCDAAPTPHPTALPGPGHGEEEGPAQTLPLTRPCSREGLRDVQTLGPWRPRGESHPRSSVLLPGPAPGLRVTKQMASFRV
ncbi:hypothetical protein H1C71_008986 [Ictidomys tridecemlineatus]|nr:hypothetical protein H1C71_008986 [Ictidomys tridecemlineatus]